MLVGLRDRHGERSVGGSPLWRLVVLREQCPRARRRRRRRGRALASVRAARMQLCRPARSAAATRSLSFWLLWSSRSEELWVAACPRWWIRRLGLLASSDAAISPLRYAKHSHGEPKPGVLSSALRTLASAYAIDASKKNKPTVMLSRTRLPRVRVEVAHVVEDDRGKNVDHA